MEKSENSKKNKILMMGCLIVMIGLMFANFYKSKTTYDVVVLGDSNIGNFRGDSSVTAVLERELNKNLNNIKVFNGGFGGSTAINTSINEASFYNLSNAIVNDEFSYVLAEAANRYDGDLDYYDVALRALSEIDFRKVKVLIVAYGTNDQLMGLNEESYATTIKDGVNKIKKSYPNLEIIVVTPFYNEGEAIRKGQPDVQVYGELLVEKCSGIKIFDAYNSGIVNAENISERTLDGVHLNEEARRLYGEMLGREVEEIMNGENHY